MENLRDVISNVKNPLDDKKTMEKLIDIYEKCERREYKYNPFYANLVKSENNSNHINEKDKEEFLTNTYNQWINNVKEIKSKDQNIKKLQKNLSEVGKIKSMEDIRNLQDRYLFGDYEEGWERVRNGWNHIKSRYITERKEKDIDVKHRLYIGCQNQDVWKMTYLFKEKCNELKIPYYFKTSESRNDNMVIYSDTENLGKYIEILEKIEKEHPDIIKRCAEPPILTGRLKKWIGIGDEPQQKYNDGSKSYNSIRAEIIEDSIEEVLLNDISKYQEKKVIINGKEISFNKLFLDKATEYIIKEKNSKENPIQIKEKLNQNISKGLKKLSEIREQKSNLVISNYDEIFSIGNVQIDTYDMDKIIKKILPEIRQIDSKFAEKVKDSMNLKLEKVGIDPNAFCFQKETIERAKQLKIFEREKNTEIDKSKTKEANKNTEKKNSKMTWIKEFINDYDATEKEYQYETRFAKEDFNMKSVLTSIENNFYSGNMSENIKPKLVKNEIGEDFTYEYSQKQISAMARLLKAADNLTIDGGRNYLEEFANIPQINNILLQMKKSDYIKEMKNQAEENRKNNSIPKYKKTMAEQDKKLAQNYLKSGNLSKKNIQDEIKYRKNLLSGDEVTVDVGAKTTKDIPLLSKQKASLTRVIARQQGKVPGKVELKDANGKWTFVVDTLKNQTKDPLMDLIEDNSYITPQKIIKDTVKSNITKQEIEQATQEIKKQKNKEIQKSNGLTK